MAGEPAITLAKPQDNPDRSKTSSAFAQKNMLNRKFNSPKVPSPVSRIVSIGEESQNLSVPCQIQNADAVYQRYVQVDGFMECRSLQTDNSPISLPRSLVSACLNDVMLRQGGSELVRRDMGMEFAFVLVKECPRLEGKSYPVVYYFVDDHGPGLRARRLIDLAVTLRLPAFLREPIPLAFIDTGWSKTRHALMPCALKFLMGGYSVGPRLDAGAVDRIHKQRRKALAALGLIPTAKIAPVKRRRPVKRMLERKRFLATLGLDRNSRTTKGK